MKTNHHLLLLRRARSGKSSMKFIAKSARLYEAVFIFILVRILNEVTINKTTELKCIQIYVKYQFTVVMVAH